MFRRTKAGQLTYVQGSTMRQLPLSKNQSALVDDEDFGHLSDHPWFFQEAPDTNGRAIRRVPGPNGGYITEHLSRVIMNPPPGMQVIHENYSGLDCRRENLRIVDAAHAQRHKRVRKDSVSGIKGVRQEGKNSFVVMLWREGRGMRVGTFRTAELANKAYRKAVEKWEKHEQERRFHPTR
jgi:hypothetical protein